MQRAAGFGCRFNPKSGDERLECSVGGPATTLASWHESLLIGTINVGLPRDFNELRVAKISRFATSALTAGKQPLCCMDRADLCLSEETASISFYIPRYRCLSQTVTNLSALAPAQRALAQRLRAALEPNSEPVCGTWALALWPWQISLNRQ
jgi:hypothetical protein